MKFLYKFFIFISTLLVCSCSSTTIHTKVIKANSDKVEECNFSKIRLISGKALQVIAKPLAFMGMLPLFYALEGNQDINFDNHENSEDINTIVIGVLLTSMAMGMGTVGENLEESSFCVS